MSNQTKKVNFGMPNGSTKMQNFVMPTETTDGKPHLMSTPPTAGPTLAFHFDYRFYSEYPARLATFKNWPKHHVGPKPADLALAGFYYGGFGDRVICFCCELGIKDWEAGDSAVREHLRFSSNCVFLKHITDRKSGA